MTVKQQVCERESPRSLDFVRLVVRESKILVITKIEDFRTTALGSSSGARCGPHCVAVLASPGIGDSRAHGSRRERSGWIERRESEIPEPTAPAADDLPLPVPSVSVVSSADTRWPTAVRTGIGLEGAGCHRRR